MDINIAKDRIDPHADHRLIVVMRPSGYIRPHDILKPHCEVVAQRDPLAGDADVAGLPVCVGGDTCVIRFLLGRIAALFDGTAFSCRRVLARVKRVGVSTAASPRANRCLLCHNAVPPKIRCGIIPEGVIYFACYGLYISSGITRFAAHRVCSTVGGFLCGKKRDFFPHNYLTRKKPIFHSWLS